MYGWNAGNLIRAALDARGRSPTLPIDREIAAQPRPIRGTEATRLDGLAPGQNFGWTYGLGTYRDPSVPVLVDANALPPYDIVIDGPDLDAPPPPRPITPILGPEDGLLVTIGIKAFDLIIAGGYFERYDQRVADYNAGKYLKEFGTEQKAYQAFVQANTADALAVGFGTVLTGGIGAKAMQLSMGLKTVAGKVLGNAAGWFAAGSFFETALQYGLTQAHQITQGASGQEDINWSSVLTAGAFGGVLGGAGTKLAYSEKFNQGVDIVSNVMQKLGQIVGLGASKAKLVAGQVPDAAMGSKLELLPTRSGAGGRVNLNDEGVVELADNLIIALAGRDLFQVPKALTQDLATAAKWYRTEMDRLANMLDKTAPLSVRLAQADKLQGLLLKAAEHSLADPDYAAAFREAFVRPGIQDLMQRHGGENGLSGSVLQEKVLAELTAPVDKARRWFEPGACFAAGTLVHTKEGLKPIEQIQVGDWVLSKPENGGEQAYKRVLKTFAHEPQRIVRLQYKLPGQDLEDLIGKAQGIRTGHINTTLNHPFWTKEEGWTAPSHMQGCGIDSFHFEDKDGNDVGFWQAQNIYLSDQPTVGWSPGWKTNQPDVSGWLWDYAQHKLVASDVLALEDIRWGEHTDPYFKAPVYNLEVEDFHTYYVGEHGIWVHNQNCGGLNFEVRNTDKPVNFANTVTAFVSRPELLNTLTARGVDKGIYLLRAHKNSQVDELVASGKLASAEDAENWVKFEEGVAGRIVSNPENVRYEYAGVFKDARTGKLNVIGIEGAEQIGQTINLIDRKLVFVKAGHYDEVMESMYRAAQFLDQNPGTTLTYEFNRGKVVEELIQLRRAKQILEDIRTGSTNGDLQIYKQGPDGVPVIDTEAMTLLRSMIGSDRIVAINVEVRVPLPQEVLQEGPGLTVPELDPAHIYLQLGQARQYWLDQGASLSRLNQARFAVADLPAGWAARTEGSTITLDASGAGWGWFVDASPQDNAEFVPLDPAASPGAAAVGDWRAAPGSAAEGKLDLLTVLFHELGHVLGLPMPQSADGSAPGEGAHAMSQYLSPGQRRLPDAVDIAALQALGSGAYTGVAQVAAVGTTVLKAASQTTPSTPAPVRPASTDQAFDAAFDPSKWRWLARGDVRFASPTATLTESPASQTRLNQVFILGAGARYLSFTMDGLALDDMAAASPLTNPLTNPLPNPLPGGEGANVAASGRINGPNDAFEVALIDANTGRSLLGGTGLVLDGMTAARPSPQPSPRGRGGQGHDLRWYLRA